MATEGEKSSKSDWESASGATEPQVKQHGLAEPSKTRTSGLHLRSCQCISARAEWVQETAESYR